MHASATKTSYSTVAFVLTREDSSSAKDPFSLRLFAVRLAIYCFSFILISLIRSKSAVMSTSTCYYSGCDDRRGLDG